MLGFAEMDYDAFIHSKVLRAPILGLATMPPLSGSLFPFQRDAVAFGLRTGSWGCFLNTGLGKTICELEWGEHARTATNGKALILTPLAVARQIEREGLRFGYPVTVIRDAGDVAEGINICNYDRLHLLDPSDFGAVALDEAAILKNYIGSQSRAIINAFEGHRFRMAATATPAPNDHTELAQHSSFLGVMTREEMLVRWFINDSGDTGVWKLKGHGVAPFFDWMASWARMAEHPRDLGDDVPGFDLPPLEIIRHQADGPDESGSIDGGLFGGEISATTLHDLKRQTVVARAAVIAELVQREPDEPWLIWCDTDYEADALLAAVEGAIDVRGSQSIAVKESRIAAFIDGTAKRLVTKPSVCGWGLNLQFCKRMAFVGRSFSYESWFQAVRRCWRFGQLHPLQVHLVVAEGEDAIGRVLDRKADDHAKMRAEMQAAMHRAIGRESARRVAYEPTHLGRLPAWLTTYPA